MAEASILWRAGCCRSVSVRPRSLQARCWRDVSVINFSCISVFRRRPAISKARLSGSSQSHNLTREALQSALTAFIGRREQVPPMHSALRHQGARLYELARRGIEVERPPRDIEIDSFELLGLDESRLTLQVTCSKGTYIRTLGQDLATALGTCGYIDRLRRLWVEPFDAEAMVTIEGLQANAAHPAGLERWLLPLDRGIESWPRVDLDADADEAHAGWTGPRAARGSAGRSKRQALRARGTISGHRTAGRARTAGAAAPDRKPARSGSVRPASRF